MATESYDFEGKHSRFFLNDWNNSSVYKADFVNSSTVIVSGVIVNAVAILGSFALARHVLGLRALDGWGSVCGGLTSSAGLHAVRQAAESNAAAIPYAAAYAVASVLATLAGPVVVLLLR